MARWKRMRGGQQAAVLEVGINLGGGVAELDSAVQSAHTELGKLDQRTSVHDWPGTCRGTGAIREDINVPNSGLATAESHIPTQVPNSTEASPPAAASDGLSQANSVIPTQLSAGNSTTLTDVLDQVVAN